jgi:hypothetical protein
MSVYYFSDQLTATGGLQLFLSTWLLGVDCLSLCVILQNFFSSSKLAPMAGPLILFLPTGIALFAALKPLVLGEQNEWI